MKKCSTEDRYKRHEKHQSDTEIPNDLWSIKNNNFNPSITWETLRNHPPNNPNTRRCTLHLNEKLKIARQKDKKDATS